MATARVPCESGACDSTDCDSTTPLDFHSVPVPSTQSSTTSHLPIEHAENLTQIKREPISSSLSNFPTADLRSQDARGSLPSNEKAADSTFMPDLQRVQDGPPPYTCTVSPLSTNNVLNYGAARPHVVTPQQNALDALAPHLSLPVSILGTRTRKELGLSLDPDVVMANNWKMMAECMEFSNREINNFERMQSPTDAVMQAWSSRATESGGPPTIRDLLNILNRDLERPDVITDIPPFILKDVQRHMNSLKRNQNSDPADMYSRMNSTPSYVHPMHGAVPSPLPTLYHSYSTPMTMYTYDSMTNMPMLNTSFEEKPVAPNTSRPVQVQEVQQSEPEQLYDAFILCNYADKQFVVEQFLPKVEKEGNLKLCLADRDMPPGNLAFVQLMNYMFQRSKKLVVILSDEFFASQEHDWQSNLAISQDPASRTQRIIPVKYKKITKRNIFDHLGCCDLTRTMEESWFWDKIIKGIKA